MRAVVFDLDGTLLDGREGIFWQYEQLTKQFDGAAASRNEIASAMHGNIEDVVRALVKNEDIPLEVLLNRYDELVVESLTNLQPYSGVTELLPILRRVGVRVAAVTSGSHHSVNALDAMGIKQYFEIIITSQHTTNPKPHPEGILLALKHMAVPVSEAAVVGDTIADIEAGKRANVAKTIAVTHGFGTIEALREAQPTHVIDDIPSLLDVLDARVGV